MTLTSSSDLPWARLILDLTVIVVQTFAFNTDIFKPAKRQAVATPKTAAELGVERLGHPQQQNDYPSRCFWVRSPFE